MNEGYRYFLDVQLLYYFDFFCRTRKETFISIGFPNDSAYPKFMKTRDFQEIEQGHRGSGPLGGMAIKKRARSTITPLSRCPNSCLLIVTRHPSR